MPVRSASVSRFPWFRFVFSVTTLVVSCRSAAAENWPQWRGPRSDGVSQETGIPLTWSRTENVAWRLPLSGAAGATPIVWGDRIFLTSAHGDNLDLLCVSTRGKLLWTQTVGTGDRWVRDDEGNAASPTPVTDGRLVWAFMANGALGCYDFEGRKQWQFDLQDKVGKFDIAFGMTSTPVLDGDRLYFQLIHTGGAKIVALEKTNGNIVWQHKRPSDAYNECEHSYASPILYRDGEREFLLSHGADYIIAHSLSDGSEIWRCGGLNPRGDYDNTLRFVASPVATEGLIVVPSAKNGPVLGLRPDGKGDVSESTAAHIWVRPQNTPDVPSPLIHDGLVYLCREDGRLICMDAKTGVEQYHVRTHTVRHRASPVVADGHIYLTGRDGVVSVVKAGREFELVATNSLGEVISASPAISGGTLYLRSFDALYAIRNVAGK